MIKENTVDLTGMVFGKKLIEYDRYAAVYFNLSMKHTYTDNDGNKVSTYNNVSCSLSANKNAEGQYNRSFDYFKEHVSEGSLLRVQGMIISWTKGLLRGEIVQVTEENKKEIERFLSQNMIRVSDYKVIGKANKTASSDPDPAFEPQVNEYDQQPDFELPEYKRFA